MFPVIHIVGEINEAMFLSVSKQLNKFESEFIAGSPVIIELCSEGGHAYDGLAIAGRLLNSPLTIHIKAYGKVMSAATAILAVGDVRQICRYCWIMVHDSTDRFKGQLDEMERQARQLDREEQQWATLLSEFSDAPADTWRKLSKKTTYLTASQALQLGLVDKINEGK